MNRQRLETVFETRVTGWGFDDYSRPSPTHTTYHIGHGQQLARQRADERRTELATRHAGQGVGDLHTRQQTRSVTLKARKAVEKDRQRDATAAELKAFRANPGVVSSRESVARRAAHRKAANAARANTSPFKHLHRSARLRAEAAQVIADTTTEAPAKPKRVRAKKAAA